MCESSAHLKRHTHITTAALSTCDCWFCNAVKICKPLEAGTKKVASQSLIPLTHLPYKTRSHWYAA
jgi:hypothetical protein